ncbi:MAG: hypothetical protein HQ488_01415 [Parcubacteria group bacterium]|nr:hypothetical protein [Parcubacteria group bacterium]
MKTPDDEYPWVFGRDEIDLLEDEIEDLFQKYGLGSKKSSEMEVQVLHEQVETEEQSDAELSARLGLGLFEPDDPVLGETPFSDHKRPHHDVGNMRLHPIYQRARLWAAELHAWAKGSYESGGAGRGDVFRIYVNVNLVPIKLFTALHEEQHGDQIGLEVAEQEYHLGQTYLERILESLTLVMIIDQPSESLEKLRIQAQELHAIVIGQLAMIKRKKNNL